MPVYDVSSQGAFWCSSLKVDQNLSLKIWLYEVFITRAMMCDDQDRLTESWLFQGTEISRLVDINTTADFLVTGSMVAVLRQEGIVSRESEM